MIKFYRLIIFLFLSLNVLRLNSIDPVSVLVGGGAIGGFKFLYNTNLWKNPMKSLTKNVYEFCSLSLNKFEKEDMISALTNKLYGQNIAIDVVTNAIWGHINDHAPNKPLVLSLHGWAGVGKNYITQLVCEQMYTKGVKSKNVHFFSGGYHFSNENENENIKDTIMSWIEGNATACKYSMFVFDEVDKISPKVLESIKVFLDHGVIGKGHLNRCIFIFLSNIGGENITMKMLKFWNEGKIRDELSLKDFEPVLTQIAYEMEGGFQNSALVSSNLIDHYIPFLPLEKDHVEKCISNQFEELGVSKVTESMLQEVMNSIEYGPEPYKVYSKTGCKRIRQKVTYIISKFELTD